MPKLLMIVLIPTVLVAYVSSVGSASDIDTMSR